VLEIILCKGELKATTELHNFLLQYKNTTSKPFNTLKKLDNEVQAYINVKRKQVTLELYFIKAS
jgi:hypothetical protein